MYQHLRRCDSPCWSTRYFSASAQNGSPNWVASVATPAEAKEIVKQLARLSGHFEYFVYDFDFVVGKDALARQGQSAVVEQERITLKDEPLGREVC